MSAEPYSTGVRCLRADSTGTEVLASAECLLEQVRLRLQGSAPDAFAETVHQVRVDIKRLRALWHLTGPGIGRKHRAALHQATRRIGAGLAAERDRTVMHATLHALAVDKRSTLLTPVLAELHQPLDPQAQVLLLSDARQSLEQLARQLVCVPWHQVQRVHLREGVIRTGERSQALYRQAATDIQALHRWRRWVKIGWYQWQWLLPAPRAWMLALKPLGSRLGTVHDLDILQQWLCASPDRQPACRALSPVLVKQRRRLLRQVDSLAAQVYAQPAHRRCHRGFKYWLAGG